MTLSVNEVLIRENNLLSDQLNQIRYHLVGSRGLKLPVTDVEIGQQVYCDADDIHHVVANFLLPSVSCLDIGPGLRPQRMLDCATHILIEPWRPYADKLVVAYPEKYTVCSLGEDYLRSALDKSVDTIFLLDVIEHLEKEAGKSLLKQALRVARIQVVIFTPLGFMPQHFSEIGTEWGDVEHGDFQNHLSGWDPSEFPNAIHVICENYHNSVNNNYGAFYSILRVAEPVKPQLVLISEAPPEGTSFGTNDVIVADVAFSELSHVINTVPKRNMVIVPLQLVAEQSTMPVELLRRVVINFPVLQNYLNQFDNVRAYGIAANVVLQRHQNHWR